jgi:hypothetical protein
VARTAMSRREVKRGMVLARVKAGDVPLGDAAQLLGVSYRQAKRLSARYRGGGGTSDGSDGRTSASWCNWMGASTTGWRGATQGSRDGGV